MIKTTWVGEEVEKKWNRQIKQISKKDHMNQQMSYRDWGRNKGHGQPSDYYVPAVGNDVIMKRGQEVSRWKKVMSPGELMSLDEDFLPDIEEVGVSQQ